MPCMNHFFIIFLSTQSSPLRVFMILVLEQPKPRHSSHSYISKVSTDSISLLNENRLSSGSSSSDHDSASASNSNVKPEIAVRRIAGMKISALFEV